MDLDEAKLQNFVALAQSEVAYCLNCQPRDTGEWVWIFGIETEMEDLFIGLDIPEEYWEEVASRLKCPHGGTQLDISYNVGLKSDYEKQIDELWVEWYSEYEWRFDEFYEFLEKYPYLGAHHELGKGILEKVQKMPQCVVKEEEWYRAVVIKESKILNSADMYPPDPHQVVVFEGRFNHFGQSVFYLADSSEGAAKEVLEESGLAWLQKFKVGRATEILDLTRDPFGEPDPELDVLTFGLIYGRVIEKSVKRNQNWKPEYFVPRYVADCARSQGFKGIKFMSNRHYGKNLVLFFWDVDNIKPVDDPFVFELMKSSISRRE